MQFCRKRSGRDAAPLPPAQLRGGLSPTAANCAVRTDVTRALTAPRGQALSIACCCVSVLFPATAPLEERALSRRRPCLCTTHRHGHLREAHDAARCARGHTSSHRSVALQLAPPWPRGWEGARSASVPGRPCVLRGCHWGGAAIGTLGVFVTLRMQQESRPDREEEPPRQQRQRREGSVFGQRSHSRPKCRAAELLGSRWSCPYPGRTGFEAREQSCCLLIAGPNASARILGLSREKGLGLIAGSVLSPGQGVAGCSMWVGNALRQALVSHGSGSLAEIAGGEF